MGTFKVAANRIPFHQIGAFLLLFGLLGCSNTKDANINQQHIDELTEQVELLRASLEQQKEDWQAYQPGLKRLLALEEDFKQLIVELDRLAKAEQQRTANEEPRQLAAKKPANNSAKQKVGEVHVQPSSPVLTKKTSSDNKPKAPIVPRYTAIRGPDTEYALQLASYRDQRNAYDGWLEFKKRFPRVLGDKTFLVSQVDLGRDVYYRLVAGPIGDRTTADALCRSLKADNASCVVAAFDGEPLLN